MQLNMHQIPAERAKKRLIWTNSNLLIADQKTIYRAATNAEKYPVIRCF